MPRGDRTGPNGMGPRTGRGAGMCSGFDRPGYMNGGGSFGYGRGMGYGRGFGRGMGFGRGFGYGYVPAGGYTAPYAAPYSAPYSKEIEKSYLENEINILKEQLKASESRLADIDSED